MNLELSPMVHYLPDHRMAKRVVAILQIFYRPLSRARMVAVPLSVDGFDPAYVGDGFVGKRNSDLPDVIVFCGSNQKDSDD